MFHTVTKSIEWGGRTLTLETGKVARQACGAVMVSYGNTKVLCTVVSSRESKEGIDFFPLTVVYQEKHFAAGRIPGGFLKRESKPSEKEVLTSRLIDRSIRPLFPKNYYNDTQVICTVLSHDLVNDSDMPALIGAAAAIAISDIPFSANLAGSKIGLIDGNFILNPNYKQVQESDLELVIAGTHDSVLMVESEAYELSEAKMLEALRFGHEAFQPVIKLIEELRSEAGKPKRIITDNHDPELKILIKNFVQDRILDAFKVQEKQPRRELLAQIKEDTLAHFTAQEYDINLVATKLKKLESEIIREQIVKHNKRIDGRDSKSIRPIECEVDYLPQTHGSALFTRGETQAIVVTTLGSSQDEQIIDSLESGEIKEAFNLHYNFPPFSVGEVSMMRAPGRREIGHGKLAWRALRPVLPSKDVFPYTIRVVSEITESNGSSSMASVCGGTLSLMDAGVPIKSPVAGIAMGLIKEQDSFVVLSDILGDEDHLGDMDFKVTATDDGLTALQMDIKVTGINFEIIETAIHQARQGVHHILGIMKKTLSEPRKELSHNAPTIFTTQINKDKIKDLIGPGGKHIREICDLAKVKIDILEDGTVKIFASNKDSLNIAIEMVESIAGEPQIDQVYLGKVTSVVDFGAFITLPGNREGLLHISEINKNRSESIHDNIHKGDTLWVKVSGIDNRGKVKLTKRDIDQETGQEIVATASSDE
ncbi:polyribonucleotide nucleotidyltransferase [Rickettsiales endosymbiont of Stachyamoeba lipophora]|uniref:polyribonucleotide nucleotidyltransferase n=1 Tax=Rickettsiales endosymbiont of Stachyamoeba lipophora TaxID=2486578 RepID=UPI000F64BBA9|nr:polyribonucleotide nucleotidyltransferase [Rickettsiales endosymbiont of Stachyamoeba lipophora]AZL15193.1 polyribonucleotide nucleotidyltransferase [Rickettsiales endosymbiont of Stachyamoeba lipophora]